METRIIEVLRGINPSIGEDVDADIIEAGLIDSLEIVNIVMDLEDEFEVEIDPELVVAENFNTISNIAKMLEAIINQ